jgi:hypothetical protein
LYIGKNIIAPSVGKCESIDGNALSVKKGKHFACFSRELMGQNIIYQFDISSFVYIACFVKSEYGDLFNFAQYFIQIMLVWHVFCSLLVIKLQAETAKAFSKYEYVKKSHLNNFTLDHGQFLID